MRMLPQVLKSLFTKPFTRRYPKEEAPLPDSFRGEHIYDRKKCIGCGNCVRHCPSNAIKMLENKKVEFDLFHCIYCGLCAEVCPVKCIGFEKKLVLGGSSTNRSVK